MLILFVGGGEAASPTLCIAVTRLVWVPPRVPEDLEADLE